MMAENETVELRMMTEHSYIIPFDISKYRRE